MTHVILTCVTLCVCEGTNITYLSATDPDDDDLVFRIVGDARVLAAGPLLRVVNTTHKQALVVLNAPLNAVVRHSLCL